MEDEAKVEEGCGRDMGGVLLRKNTKRRREQPGLGPALLLPMYQTRSQSQWSRFQEPDWRSLSGPFPHTVPGCYRILPCSGPSIVLDCGLREPWGKKKSLSLGFPALPKILAPPPSGFRFPEHPPGSFPLPSPARVPHKLLDLEGGVTFLGQLLLG